MQAPLHAAPAEVAARLAELPGLNSAQLRMAWKALYRAEPPIRLSRDLLMRFVAYRIQELAMGGLSQAMRRRLRTLDQAHRKGRKEPLKSDSVKPGAELLREWRGETHLVLVLEDGYSYRDRHYTSLTQIARQITSVHWSGPRFFGLNGHKAVRRGPIA